jgi:hypothetical protein
MVFYLEGAPSPLSWHHVTADAADAGVIPTGWQQSSLQSRHESRKRPYFLILGVGTFLYNSVRLQVEFGARYCRELRRN